MAHESRPLRIEENVLKTRTVRHPCSRLRYHIEICRDEHCSLPRVVPRTTRPAPDVLRPSNMPRMKRMAWSPPACNHGESHREGLAERLTFLAPIVASDITPNMVTLTAKTCHQLPPQALFCKKPLTLPVGYLWQSHDCGNTVSMAPKKTARCELPRISVLNA